MDKLAEKLHQLPKFEDEKESNLGYIYGVSGPGIKNKKNSILFFFSTLKYMIYSLNSSRCCQQNGWQCNVRVGSCRLLTVSR